MENFPDDIRPRRSNFSLLIATAALVIGALVIALWPVKTDAEFMCGSFLAPNNSIYDQALGGYTGAVDGPAMRNNVDLEIPLLQNALRAAALETVDECSSRRNVQGAIAGTFLLLAFGAGGFIGWRVSQWREQDRLRALIDGLE